MKLRIFYKVIAPRIEFVKPSQIKIKFENIKENTKTKIFNIHSKFEEGVLGVVHLLRSHFRGDSWKILIYCRIEEGVG